MELIVYIGGIVVTIITTIITTFFMNRRKAKNLDANTDSIVVTSAQNALSMMQSQLESQQQRIEYLSDEIDKLKQREKVHNQERNTLQEKIEELKASNEQLKALSKADEEEIFRLRKEIEELNTKLNK